MGQSIDLKRLVGSGDRIALFTLPVVAGGLAVSATRPAVLAARSTSRVAQTAATAVLGCGILAWAWSVVLILTKVPRRELITSGPYAVVRHPLYTSVGLLVLPAAGVLRHTWLGALVGLAVYVGSRRYAPVEERDLAATFGSDWEAYRRHVLLPWL